MRIGLVESPVATMTEESPAMMHAAARHLCFLMNEASRAQRRRMATVAMTSIGIYKPKTNATAGTRLPSSSFISVMFVVTTLRNMSTPIIDCPNSIVITIWKAAKNTRGNIIHTIVPIFLHEESNSQ